MTWGSDHGAPARFSEGWCTWPLFFFFLYFLERKAPENGYIGMRAERAHSIGTKGPRNSVNFIT
jgi:hypothetical protein